MGYILTTDNLTKKYGSKVAANNINIHVREGEIYGLIGRNGAGKTTIMRMISGLSRPTSGTYQINCPDSKGVGVLIEDPGLFLDRSAFENLKIKALALSCYSREHIESLLRIVGLSAVADKAVKGFSLGMRQRLGIALALVGDPKLIVLDEPINGLDPQGIAELRDTFGRLRDERGVTIMISSHILGELGKLADSYGIINEGELIDELTKEELLRRCGKFITLNTYQNDKAAEVLESMGTRSYVVRPDGIRVGEGIDRCAEINRTLVSCGIDVFEIHTTNISLEDYYLNMTGGKRA